MHRCVARSRKRGYRRKILKVRDVFTFFCNRAVLGECGRLRTRPRSNKARRQGGGEGAFVGCFGRRLR
jgi:hypothetical protein